MERVIISETVVKKVTELIDILYEKGYFAIKANAEKYASDLKAFSILYQNSSIILPIS